MKILGNVTAKLHLHEFKHITAIAVFFVSVLLISNVASSKIVQLWSFEFDGGTLLFPLSYIFGDVLTEVYGYARTRKIIWMGAVMNILMAIVFIGVGALPASEAWGNQSAYEAILGLTPRIVLASIAAYLVGEFSNSYILAKIKVLMKGRFLFVRTISSTLVGQAFDTIIFVSIAFYGIFDPATIFVIIVSNYLFKVLVEVVFTPLTYLIVGALKRSEDVDVYDENTDFNPFKIK